MASHGSAISITTKGLIASLSDLPVSNYLKLADITNWKGLEWLIDATDDTEQGVFSLVMVKQISDHAQGEVDAYLNGQYSTPVVTDPDLAPKMLRLLCIKVTIYCLASRRDRVDRVIAEDYDNAIRQLEDIRDGKLRLPGIGMAEAALPNSNHRRLSTKRLLNLSREDTDGEEIDDGHDDTLGTI